MAFHVVLDADLLMRAAPRDLALRLAISGFYVAHFSDRILDEVERNLHARLNIPTEKALRTCQAMRTAFLEHLVAEEPIAALEAEMANQPKDRHVLAAAVASGSELTVTNNHKDFPARALDPFGISVMSPSQLFIDMYAQSPRNFDEVVDAQIAALRAPPSTIDTWLERMARSACRGFVQFYAPRRGRPLPPSATP